MSRMPQQAPSASELRQQIDAQVRSQVDAARAQAQAAGAEARANVETQRARMEELRAELEGARASGQGGGQVIVVPPRSEMPVSDIPREAVEISIAFFIMVAVIVIGYPIVRAFTRRMENRPASPALGADATAQLQRIEHAVDAMAIEVERISEAQRFTAKLESERIGDGSSRRGS